MDSDGAKIGHSSDSSDQEYTKAAHKTKKKKRKCKHKEKYLLDGINNTDY